MFLPVFNKTNDLGTWNDSYFTNQSEKITLGFCLKISSDFTVRKLPFALGGGFGNLSICCLTASFLEGWEVSHWNWGDTL